MLRIFRTNVVLQIFIILIVAVLMWIGVFIHPRPTPIEGGGQLYYWITGLLSPLASTIIAFVLVIVEGVLLNSMLYRHKMMTQSSLMPLLFYIIAMSIGRPTLTPMLLGSLFLIIGMSQLMLTTTLLSLDLDKIFGASASIACATLFCPAMAVFLVPLIANMFNFSLYGWRDWTMLILGILAPYIVLETYYYMVDELFYRNYLILYGLTDINWSVGGSLIDWIGSLIFLLLFVVGFGSTVINGQNKTINFKKNLTAILLFTVGSILFTLYTHIFPVHTQAFAIPFALCTTLLFVDPKRDEWWQNLIFVLVIVAFVIWNLI
jgi:hypothetical protein